MLRVCFCYTNNHWALNQWAYILDSFQVEETYVLSPHGKSLRNSELVAEAVQVATAEDLPSIPSLVVATPLVGRFVQGEEDLKDFVHPRNAIYLFGADNVNLSEDFLGERIPDHKVYITNDTQFEIFAHVAAGIFLYDRRSKS